MKRRPSHPGIILEEMYIKPLDLKQEDLAKKLHVARNTLYRLRKGTIGVTAEMAVRLGKAFNTTPQFWLNLQNAYDLWKAEKEKSASSVRPIVRPPIAAKGY
ncbi:MAG: putative HTH-type transcriptional regulator YbaQ [Chlamydiae bacterium]|nr:putative HTH-type transcriptional regulator YbaQ [Chlamydiota bacterium]